MAIRNLDPLPHNKEHIPEKSSTTRPLQASTLSIIRKTGFIILIALSSGLVVWESTHITTSLAAGTAPKTTDESWLEDIEKIFIPSRHCKQCHDRHYEEWKGMRERTEDLKSFGRIDGALLHGNALKSPVFKTVLGLWLQTQPSPEQRTKCLVCHAPAVTVFPEHTDRIIEQVLQGPKQVRVEGIGCTSCHLISETRENAGTYPTFKIDPGLTMFGPYDKAEENMVHASKKSELYDNVNYCTACHFSKVRDVTQPHLEGRILKDMVCQDCHMEQSTGSSTSKRGRLTRPIGRHWFQGVIKPGIMLSNRNVQAEWSPHLDVKTVRTPRTVEATVTVRNGNLVHMFPGGDPVLKQFFVSVRLKDKNGNVVGTNRQEFGRSFEELLRGPIPLPLISGGTTRRIKFSIGVPEDVEPELMETLISYTLIPTPGKELKDRYLATLTDHKARNEAEHIIAQYTSPRLLTFRTNDLNRPNLQAKKP